MQFIGHIELQKKKSERKSLVLQASFRAGNREAAASMCKGCHTHTHTYIYLGLVIQYKQNRMYFLYRKSKIKTKLKPAQYGHGIAKYSSIISAW